MHIGAAMMRFGSNLNLTAALSGFTPRFLGVVRGVGPAENGGRVTLDIRGAKNLHQREELMDTPTSAAPNENTSQEMALATQPSKSATQEKSRPSGPLEISAERISSSVGRLTSNSIEELQGLASELQKMQEFLKSEVDNVQHQIDSALAGINIIIETISPWKSIADSQTLPSGARNVRAGGPAANIEQRSRVG